MKKAKQFQRALWMLPIMAIWMMLITSCQKATFLNVDTSNVNTTIEGCSGDISISTDGTSVDIVHSPQWVKTSINEDLSVLHYEVTMNTDRKLREDSIVLKSSDLTCAICVTQSFKATYIKFDRDTIEFPRNGGTAEVNVEVDATTPLQVDNHELAKVDGRKITITVPKSKSKWGLFKELIVSCDDISAKLIIKQESGVCPTCDGEGFLNQPCPVCNGFGAHVCCSYTGKKRCPTCGGSGMSK